MATRRAAAVVRNSAAGRRAPPDTRAQALRRTFFSAAASKEMPLSALADRLAAPFSEALESLSSAKRGEGVERLIFVPSLPAVLCLSRAAANSALLRDILVVDSSKPPLKPRLSWYNPYDTTWIPSGWFAEGLVADMHYYYGASLAQPAPEPSDAFFAPFCPLAAQPNGA